MTRRTKGPGEHGHLTGGRCHPEYRIWTSLIQRCRNPGCREYPHYGGRGVRVCRRWLARQGFANFLADVGPRPRPDLTLHRIDNDGDYEPANVAWADRAAQQRHTRGNHVLAHGGRRMIVTDWALALGMRPGTLFARLRRGWSVEQTLTQPVATRKPFNQWAKPDPATRRKPGRKPGSA